MNTYIVTAAKLNKRSVIPASLPDPNSIAGVVFKDYTFSADEVDAADIPNPALGKWYRDTDGYFYWGGGIMLQHASGNVLLTLQQVRGGSGALAVNAQKFLPYITDTCNKYNINTPIRQLCFLAQMGHESGGLFFTEELASGAAYEGRKSLGNTEPGDGVRFKGRGLIQITGRTNYRALSKAFTVDFISNPTELGGKNANACTPDQLKYSAMSAGWYWDENNLNAVADKIDIQQPLADDNLKAFQKLTRLINGGLNGIDDRVKRYQAGLPYFKQ